MLFWECNTKPNEKCIKKIKNVFIAEILNAWCTITYEPPLNNFKDQILWNNSAIIIGQNTVFKRSWYEKGIKNISDILDDDDKFISLNVLKNKYNLHCNFFGLLQFNLCHSKCLEKKCQEGGGHW